MLKRMLVVLALCASVVSAPAMAQGRFLDFAKATAGVMVAGVAVCTVTNALHLSGLAVCTPAQRAIARPIQPAQAHLLTPQVRERLIVVERETTVRVAGARHLSDGKCVQSNGRVGVDRNGMCFVSD